MSESEILELLWRAYEEGAEDGYHGRAFDKQEDFEKWAKEELWENIDDWETREGGVCGVLKDD